MKYTFLAPCGLPNRKVNILQALLLLLLLFVMAVVVFVAILFVYYLIDSLSCYRNMAALQPFYVFLPN
jgi:hypothetical protein